MPTPCSPALRADAQRNRERIVTAATELFVAQGVEAPLDAIARRAGVGIATLYRRFPDREALVHAVALEAFTRVRRTARAAAEADRPLRDCLHRLAELRTGVLMASLAPVLVRATDTDQLEAAFDEVLVVIRELVDRAHHLGELRADVTADDVLLLGALLTRPLDGVPTEHLDAVTPRLLHLVLEGLQPRDDATDLPAPPDEASLDRPSG